MSLKVRNGNFCSWSAEIVCQFFGNKGKGRTISQVIRGGNREGGGLFAGVFSLMSNG